MASPVLPGSEARRGGTDGENGPLVVPAARCDAVTWAQLSLVLVVAVALVLMGFFQAAASAERSAWREVLSGVAFAALGVLVGYLAVARMPVAYAVTLDPDHGPVLEVRRRTGRPLRLRLGGYDEALPRRVIFPWFPIVSGTRMFGLAGARAEMALLGFWSFGCNGRKAVVLVGTGRPATLVSPEQPERFVSIVLPLLIERASAED